MYKVRNGTNPKTPIMQNWPNLAEVGPIFPGAILLLSPLSAGHQSFSARWALHSLKVDTAALRRDVGAIERLDGHGAVVDRRRAKREILLTARYRRRKGLGRSHHSGTSR